MQFTNELKVFQIIPGRPKAPPFLLCSWRIQNGFNTTETGILTKLLDIALLKTILTIPGQSDPDCGDIIRKFF